MKPRTIAMIMLSMSVLPGLTQVVLGAEGPERPNILLIFVDDLGYGELGCQGHPQIPTPHIDSIADNGVRCTAGYVTASYCSPSRAGLLTGRYQTRFGYELNPTGRHNLDPRAGLPPSERTLAEHLQRAGYATGLIGKWHLGGRDKYHPLRHGFEEFYGFLHEGHFYVPSSDQSVISFLRKKTLPEGAGERWRQGNTIFSSHMGYDEPPYDEQNPLLRGTEPIDEEAYLTDALTREAVRFIRRHREEPFFLYLSYNAVHSPMQAPRETVREFETIEDVHRRIFAGMLSELDNGVGRVLETLRRENVDGQTLVFFISDNGGPTRELTSSNAPLRGGKGSLYEGGIRVPFLVQWPGVLPAGAVYEQPVLSTDVFATASAAAGLAIPDDRTLDGVDLVPYLSGERTDSPHETLFWRMGTRTALRHGDWKIVRHRRRGKDSDFELYHLGRDIEEENNLAGKRPERLRKLHDHWERINAQMVDPVWRRDRR